MQSTRPRKDTMVDDELWCHEMQVEDVPGHHIKTSALSLLDLLAMKHATAGGTRSLKIQIAGGIIGERFHYRHNEEGKPVPSYIDCAEVMVAK